LITAWAHPSTLSIRVRTGGASGTRNGISDGLRIDLLNQEMNLADGIPFGPSRRAWLDPMQQVMIYVRESHFPSTSGPTARVRPQPPVQAMVVRSDFA
jgi:hypothetical protein